MKVRAMRIILLALLAAILTGTLTQAMAATAFEAVVTSSRMKIYRESEPHDQIGELPKGTVVTVKDYSGKAALIAYQGFTGIARISDMKAVKSQSSASEATSGTEEAPEKASSSELKHARTMVTTEKARVYRKPSKSSDYVTVGEGVKLNVLGISGGVAKVERDGVVGYMSADCLSSGEATAQAATVSEAPAASQETAVAETADVKVVKYEDKTVMTTRDCKVYAQPSTASDSVSVDKGVRLKLLAVRGGCAMVERDGVVGYVDEACLTTEISTLEITPEKPAASQSKDEDIFSGTNQQIIYKFLTRVMGYNTAAACGVLANCKYESDYKPTTSGDHGTSYGITQWHAERKDEMIQWCNQHGYEPSGLKGQLYFLQYELKTYYPAIHSQLKSIENTAQGAYDAAYDFCYKYEIPTNRASKSVTRGNYARDTLFDIYKV